MLAGLAKLLLLIAVVSVVLSGVVYMLNRVGINRLPGDFVLRGKSWKVFLPIGTSILLSVILTMMLWLIHRFKR